MERLIKYFFEDKSVEILNRIVADDDCPVVKGLWTGSAYKISKGYKMNTLD